METMLKRVCDICGSECKQICNGTICLPVYVQDSIESRKDHVTTHMNKRLMLKEVDLCERCVTQIAEMFPVRTEYEYGF